MKRIVNHFSHRGSRKKRPPDCMVISERIPKVIVGLYLPPEHVIDGDIIYSLAFRHYDKRKRDFYSKRSGPEEEVLEMARVIKAAVAWGRERDDRVLPDGVERVVDIDEFEMEIDFDDI